MDYESYRLPIENFTKEDFVTDRSRGSIGLNLGDILLPGEIDKIRQETQSFFAKYRQK